MSEQPSSPEFKEGFQAGFHEGVEQARKELKETKGAPAPQGQGQPPAGKKEEKKKPSPFKEKLGALFHNRVFQVAAAVVVVIALAALFYHAETHESTDDAYTAGHLHNIASRVAGTVLEVRVDDNQAVKQGDVLVVLDPADYQVQVDQAEADYVKAKADFDRLQPLKGDAAISQQDYDNAESAYKVAHAKLDDARNQLAYCTIRAPSDGRVGHKTVESGNRINVGAALMAVAEDVWVVANFKETQLGKVHVGQAVDIDIDAVPHKTFRGYVDSWSPGSGATFALLPPDNATGNFTKIVQRVPVKIRFNPDSIRGWEGRVVPGLSCEPSIVLKGGDPKRAEPVSPQPESVPASAVR